ncbi:hypothetical protein Bpfe_029812, partial [Biomphalaria pfeifferi]
ANKATWLGKGTPRLRNLNFLAGESRGVLSFKRSTCHDVADGAFHWTESQWA